jgi:hypothetical protein
LKLFFCLLSVKLVIILKKLNDKKGVLVKKLYVFSLIAVFCFSVYSCCGAKIKLYALYTPSHEVLKDKFFLPSIKDDFEVIIEFCEQTCPSAKFMSEGWTKTTMRKVDLIIRAIKENWGTFFIFSDVDIQFFAPIQDAVIKLMKDKDIVMQKNNPAGVLCTGFFACRGNEKTLRLWTDVKKTMKKKASNSDQNSFNQCIKKKSKKNPYNIVWAYLPDSFFGAGTRTGREWRPGMSLPIPRDIMIHHANWTKGIKNKIAQLIYVRNEVRKRQKFSKKQLS